MKGISPLIAVVLLIAFTIAVGGILSVFVTTFTSTQTKTVSSTTEAQVKCSTASLDVKEVRYPASGATGRVNVTVIYSTGSETLANITVQVVARGGIVQATSTSSVAPGESRAIQVVSANIPPEVVRAFGICQSTVPVVGECKAGESCMKSV